MTEEDTPPEEAPKEEPPKEPPEKDVKLKATELIKQQNESAERMEAANKKHEELLEDEAKIKLEKAFDGQADAGTGKKEDSDSDYANKVMANDLEKGGGGG